MDRSMIRKAEIARERASGRGATEAPGRRDAPGLVRAVELRAAARTRVGVRAIKPGLTAAALIARAAEVRKQMRRG
jgi:hypothetical protein